MSFFHTGNCVFIKPSELSEHTAEAIADILPKYLDPVSPAFDSNLGSFHVTLLAFLPKGEIYQMVINLCFVR